MLECEEFLNGVTQMDTKSAKCDTLELQSRVRMLLHNHHVHHGEMVEQVRTGLGLGLGHHGEIVEQVRTGLGLGLGHHEEMVEQVRIGLGLMISA